ncbi:MAG: toxin-antitoxin system HicB family antitoxin [Stellaceae bacterium]
MNPVNERKLEAADYLKKPYARQVVPEPDGSFRAEILEFPGCIALGGTQSEALASLEKVAKGWLEGALAKGQPISEPIEDNTEYSGKLVLRLPKSLHRRATYVAQREGVSLNQYIVTALATHVSEATFRVVVQANQLMNNLVNAFTGSLYGTAPRLMIVQTGGVGVNIYGGNNSLWNQEFPIVPVGLAAIASRETPRG